MKASTCKLDQLVRFLFYPAKALEKGASVPKTYKRQTIKSPGRSNSNQNKNMCRKLALCTTDAVLFANQVLDLLLHN